MFGISVGWKQHPTKRFEIKAVLDNFDGYYVVLDMDHRIFFVWGSDGEGFSWRTDKVESKKEQTSKKRKGQVNEPNPTERAARLRSRLGSAVAAVSEQAASSKKKTKSPLKVAMPKLKKAMPLVKKPEKKPVVKPEKEPAETQEVYATPPDPPCLPRRLSCISCIS